MNSLGRFFANRPKQSRILIGFGFALFAVCYAATGYAKIDPKTVVGIWLFDEGNGKVAEDLSGNGHDGELK
ncbi:MAG: hypothetical protein OXI24_15055 [Candidatus Poribacteria bacterium]|nr:hypothetical protein [Candidatus Poribacteria bacterium]